MLSKPLVATVALLAITLSGCAGSTPPPVHRAEIPDTPKECLEPTKLPAAKVGGDLEVFAADNRKAARNEGATKLRCGQFSQDVKRGYGALNEQ